MQKTVEVYEQPPERFNPQVEIAACYIEINGLLLLLQRALEKSEPGLWGVPAGKLEHQEMPENAARRELFEETGISVLPVQVQPIGLLYIRKKEGDYVYHLFKINGLENRPIIRLSSEHQNFRWATPQDLEEIPLIPGAKEALKKYSISNRLLNH